MAEHTERETGPAAGTLVVRHLERRMQRCWLGRTGFCSAVRAAGCLLCPALTGMELERLRGGDSSSKPQSDASAATAPSTPPLAARRGRLLRWDPAPPVLVLSPPFSSAEPCERSLAPAGDTARLRTRLQARGEATQEASSWLTPGSNPEVASQPASTSQSCVDGKQRRCCLVLTRWAAAGGRRGLRRRR